MGRGSPGRRDPLRSHRAVLAADTLRLREEEGGRCWGWDHGSHGKQGVLAGDGLMDPTAWAHGCHGKQDVLAGDGLMDAMACRMSLLGMGSWMPWQAGCPCWGWDNGCHGTEGVHVENG